MGERPGGSPFDWRSEVDDGDTLKGFPGAGYAGLFPGLEQCSDTPIEDKPSSSRIERNGQRSDTPTQDTDTSSRIERSDPGLSPGNTRKRSIEQVTTEVAPKKPASHRANRRKKKPNGIPKRPLCAYNYFFQKERIKLQEEDARISFEELGKIVGRRWKDLPEEDRKQYSQLAREDSIRYRKEMESYRNSNAKNEDGKSRKKESGGHTNIEPWEPSSVPNADSLSLPSLPTRAAGPMAQHTLLGQSFAPLSSPNFSRPSPWSQQQGPASQSYGDSYGPMSSGAVPMQRDAFPIPPGMEVFLPDASGQEQRYTVRYTMFSMTREEADRYLESLVPPPAGPSHGEDSAQRQGQQQQLPTHPTQQPSHDQRRLSMNHPGPPSSIQHLGLMPPSMQHRRRSLQVQSPNRQGDEAPPNQEQQQQYAFSSSPSPLPQQPSSYPPSQQYWR